MSFRGALVLPADIEKLKADHPGLKVEISTPFEILAAPNSKGVLKWAGKERWNTSTGAPRNEDAVFNPAPLVIRHPRFVICGAAQHPRRDGRRVSAAERWSDGGGECWKCITQNSATPKPPGSNSPAALDSRNRVLWRQNPRRLDAESLHDAVLAVSGKLNIERGGPGFRDSKYTEAYALIYDYRIPDKPELWRRSI